MCNICYSNASNFRTSELRALNIEYFRYVHGEAYNTVAPLCYHLPSKYFIIMIFYNNMIFAGYRNDVKYRIWY